MWLCPAGQVRLTQGGAGSGLMGQMVEVLGFGLGGAPLHLVAPWHPLDGLSLGKMQHAQSVRLEPTVHAGRLQSPWVVGSGQQKKPESFPP